MANKNLTLTQVSDVLSTLGYMIALENENLSSEDLYTMTGDLEASIAALLYAAKRREDEIKASKLA
jgi:hypothetical protein